MHMTCLDGKRKSMVQKDVKRALLSRGCSCLPTEVVNDLPGWNKTTMVHIQPEKSDSGDQKRRAARSDFLVTVMNME